MGFVVYEYDQANGFPGWRTPEVPPQIPVWNGYELKLKAFIGGIMYLGKARQLTRW